MSSVATPLVHPGIRLAWMGATALILIADQASKAWIESWLNPYEPHPVYSFFSLLLVYNKGAAFSFLSDASGWQRWFFIALAVIVCVYLLHMLWQLRPGQKLLGCAATLITGGAAGNLWDRWLNGEVTDFILLHYQGYYFPAFNLADSAISLGLILWLAMVLRDFRAPPGALDK